MGDPYKVPGGQQQAHYVSGEPPSAGNFHVAPYSSYPLPRAPYFVYTSKDTHAAAGSHDHYAAKRPRIDASAGPQHSMDQLASPQVLPPPSGIHPPYQTEHASQYGISGGATISAQAQSAPVPPTPNVGQSVYDPYVHHQPPSHGYENWSTQQQQYGAAPATQAHHYQQQVPSGPPDYSQYPPARPPAPPVPMHQAYHQAPSYPGSHQYQPSTYARHEGHTFSHQQPPPGPYDGRPSYGNPQHATAIPSHGASAIHGLAPQEQKSKGNQSKGNERGRSGRQPIDPSKSRAIQINKRITVATTYKDILDVVQYELDSFDPIALATAVHRLGSLRGAPGMHEQIVRSPEFFKLMNAVRDRAQELHIRNIANIVWGLAKMNYLPGDDVMERLCKEIEVKAMDGVAQNIANTLWALSSLQYRPNDATLSALADAVRSKIHDFTSQHISNTCLAFAKMEHAIDPDILDLLGREALNKIGTFTAQALSNTLWSLSKLGIADGDLFSAVGAAAKANLSSFNSQNLANSVWAYGNLLINPGEDVLAEYAAYCVRSIDSFTPQNVSNVVWAFAKLGNYNADLFKAAAWRGVETIHAFTPQSLANFVWAYATLNVAPDPAFLRVAVSHALKTLDQWAPQNLSNVAWALANLKKDHEAAIETALNVLLPAVVAEVTRRLMEPQKEKEFSRQHLANFIWALGVASYDPGEVALRTAASSLRTRLSLCIPQEITNALSAFAKLQFYDGSLLEEFAAEAVNRIDEFEGQNISQLVWSFAKLSHYNSDLMAASASAIDGQAGDISLQNISMILYAYAVLNVSVPHMFNYLIEEIKQRMENPVTEEEIETLSSHAAPIMWSTAVLDVLDKTLWDTCMKRLVTSSKTANKLAPETLAQIFQVCMLQEARHPDQEWPMDENLRAEGEAAWKKEVSDVTISEFHSEVSRTLRAMGIDHHVEHLTEDGLFSVDVAIPQEKIAIEVDGPHHFTRNSLRPLGDMFTRFALLESRGWKVVSVPFFRWSGVDADGQRDLLSNLLERVRSGQHAHPTKEDQTAGP